LCPRGHVLQVIAEIGLPVKILSIDTSGAVNVIGLADGQHVLADLAWEARDNSLERVITNLDLVLKRGNTSLEDIQGMAVGIGPGSWTGVRVGVTVAKTLSYVCDRPVCAVTSLEAMAYQARDSDRLLVPLIDAGRDNVYAGFFRSSGKTVASAGDYYAGGIEELVDRVREPALFLGKAAHVHRQVISNLSGSLASFGSPSGISSGCVFAWLALPRFLRGDVDDALSLTPLYLKESLAQALLRRSEPAVNPGKDSIC
jgi:tRNA threonylcarbamoyladenosine biosynthesis protein TsaB